MFNSFFYRPELHLSKRGGHHGSTPGGGEYPRKVLRDAITPGQPAWARGLQRLYNDVVDEALPDDLAKLLDKLDRAADGE